MGTLNHRLKCKNTLYIVCIKSLFIWPQYLYKCGLGSIYSRGIYGAGPYAVDLVRFVVALNPWELFILRCITSYSLQHFMHFYIQKA
jgi:hypothetical protein